MFAAAGPVSGSDPRTRLAPRALLRKSPPSPPAGGTGRSGRCFAWIAKARHCQSLDRSGMVRVALRGCQRLHPGAKSVPVPARGLVPLLPTEDARQRYRKSEGASVSFPILSGGAVIGIVRQRRDVTELADRLLAGVWAFLHSLAALTHRSQTSSFEDGRHTLRPKMSVR
jgi:hypothetical protein